MTQLEIAAALDLSPAVICRLVKRGMPTDCPASAEQWRRQNVRARVRVERAAAESDSEPSAVFAPPPSFIAPPPAPPSPARPYTDNPPAACSYQEARRRDAVASAEIRELEVAELRGDLVRRAAVVAALGRRVASLREALLQMPARLVPQLAATTDPIEMDQLLREEVTRALEQVSSASV